MLPYPKRSGGHGDHTGDSQLPLIDVRCRSVEEGRIEPVVLMLVLYCSHTGIVVLSSCFSLAHTSVGPLSSRSRPLCTTLMIVLQLVLINKSANKNY